MVTYARRRERRPRLQGTGRCVASLPARPALRTRRADADRARIAIGDDAIRRHEASSRARSRGPRRHALVRQGEAAFSQSRAHPVDPQPVDPQIRRAPGVGARGTQGGAGGKDMATDTKAGVTTQVYEVYIRATPEAIWDAITS